MPVLFAQTTFKNLPAVLAFVAGTALFWGVYVPTVHEASNKLGSSLRAFLFVGLAYFIVAVIIPSIMIFSLNWDPTVKPKVTPNFATLSMTWGLAAGLAGAIGALCVIFAAANAGPGGALYVAPLVFAGAPIVNTIATITIFHPTKTLPNPYFFLGLLLAVAGAALVLLNKPTDPSPAVHNPPAQSTPASDK